jgi:hypothetical protein
VNFASEQDGLAIEQKGKEGEDDSQLGLRWRGDVSRSANYW